MRHAHAPRAPRPSRRAAAAREAAVADVISSILMIGVTVLMMGAVFVAVLAIPAPVPTAHADIATELFPGPDGKWGTRDEAVTFVHRGGDPLAAGPTSVRLTIDGAIYEYDSAQLEAMGNTFPITIGKRIVITQRPDGQPLAIYGDSQLEATLIGFGGILASTTENFIPVVGPSSPTLLSAVRGDRTVALTWTPPLNASGLTGYSVYRGTSSGTETLITSGPCASPTVSPCTDDGLTNGQTYYYVVAAVTGSGESPPSNELSGRPATVPGAPGGLVAQGGDRQVQLNWTAPASDGGEPLTSYHITRRNSSSGLDTFWDISAPNDGFLDASNLQNAVQYYYNVSAKNAVGEGPKAAITAMPVGVPSQPTISATRGNATITLTWSAVNGNGNPVTKYTVYRGTSAGGEVFVTDVSAGATTWVDKNGNVTNGVTYYYQLSASNSQGESIRSSEISAKPADRPGTPLSFTGARGNQQAVLDWVAPADNGEPITNYTLHRKNGATTVNINVGNLTTYNDTGLTNGVAYQYNVTAWNVVGESLKTANVTVTPAAVPDAPVLSFTRSNQTVSLSWTVPANNGNALTKYTVYRGSGSGNETPLASGGCGNPGLSTSCTDAGLTNGNVYYYQVTATNGVGEGPPSSEVSAKPASQPGVPGSFAGSRGNQQAVLTWTLPLDNGEALTNYTLRRVNGATTVNVNIADPNSTVYTWNGLTNGVAYDFTLMAWNVMGKGNNTATVTVTPAATPDGPVITATRSNQTVTITWPVPNNNGSPISGYTMFRSTSPGTESFLTNIGSGATSYTDNGLTNGQTYYYELSATNGAGEGPRSGEKSAKPAAVPATPTGLTLSITVSGGSGTVTMNWNVATDNGEPVTRYNVYRSVNGAAETNVNVGNTTTYTDSSVPTGPLYYNVTATNAVGESGRIAIKTNTQPATPSGFSATHTGGSGGNNDLKWAQGTATGGSAVTSYAVYRGTTSGNAVFYKNLTLGGGVDQYSACGSSYCWTDSPTDNNQYWYQLTAWNAVGESAKTAADQG